LLIDIFNRLPANIKEGIATKACGADGCFSGEAISMTGVVFCKGVCTAVAQSFPAILA